MKASPKDLELLANLRVLYVEDEPDTREQTARMLGLRVGHLVVAKDGVEGLECFRNQVPDLVVTDILMPRLDGLGMAQQMRLTAPDLPILVTTAFDQTSHLLRAIEVGIDHYVVKPIDSDHLESLLAKCARRLHSERQAQRLEAEAQRLHRQEALGILAQGLAHDFNNLLQAILGWVDIAQMHAQPGSKVAVALEHVENNQLQARTLSERLLILGEAQEFKRVHGPLEALLHQEVREALQGSFIEVRFELQDGSAALDYNPPQLGQVFGNLTRNAREAMGDRGLLRIHSEVTTLLEENPIALTSGSYLHLAFIDEGPGIKPELLPRIFDPYVTTKQAFSQKGLGLGLALCQAIIHHHRGALVADTRLGEGSTFHVYLPLAAESEAQP